MLPDSQTGFAPVARGVAETNARVTVRQRGVLLDEATVAPGPFVLNDLFPTGYGGDLTVTITEADGRKREFIVPFAANANLLRPGYSRYALSIGQLDEIGLRHPPNVMQSDLPARSQQCADRLHRDDSGPGLQLPSYWALRSTLQWARCPLT